MVKIFSFNGMYLVCLAVFLSLCPQAWSRVENDRPPVKRYCLTDIVTIAANSDFSFRKTNFFRKDHDTTMSFIEGRLELWLPPFRRTFSWGPYIRGALIASNREPAFENGWLARPGLGIQVYPFSYDTWTARFFRELAPVRLFAEYNMVDYWGAENRWRPDDQTRAGFDYYREINVNRTTRAWWLEIFNMLVWNSSNEFDSHYDSLVFANSLRAGLRIPGTEVISSLTPYVIFDSSLSENPSYFWENRLRWGGGVRFAPDLRFLPKGLCWINRFVVYAEYLDVITYYHDSPSDIESLIHHQLEIPSYDFRIGLSISVGDFYK